MKRKNITFVFIIIIFLFASLSSFAQTRIKDIAKIAGLEDKRVTGFGLVTGLNGSGDGTRAIFTIQAFANLLQRMDVRVDARGLRMRNIAAVMVSANIPPFTKRGDKVDVVVSSVGDAKSLQGGTLVRSELNDLTGKVIGYAQGPISTGGINQGAGAGAGRTNFELVGRVANGAKIEEDLVSSYIDENSEIKLKLDEPDFTSASRVIQKINKEFGENTAYAIDAASISVKIPKSYIDMKDEVGFISRVENLVIDPDIRAKVVINERTGTVVVGSDVTISTVAISHGDLTIDIIDPAAGQQAAPQQGSVVLMRETAKVGDLAAALNALRVSPEDIIAIFQALKELGALNAELVIM